MLHIGSEKVEYLLVIVIFEDSLIKRLIELKIKI